jgi:hypothetical protein
MGMANDNEWTVQEMIDLELGAILAMIDTNIETFGYALPKYTQIRDSLVSLLARLETGDIQAEYAEIELEKISDRWKP